jgi:hypothetical protein
MCPAVNSYIGEGFRVRLYTTTRRVSSGQKPAERGQRSKPVQLLMGLFVSASGNFWPPKAAADCQTLSFSASFYKICWGKNHPNT